MNIRAGGPADAGPATELFSRADAARDGRPFEAASPEAIQGLHARLCDPDARLLLGYEGAELIATAMSTPARRDGGTGDLIPAAAHVSLIGVAPEYWGRGYGRTILQELTKWLRSAGLERLSLSVVAANTRARRLYERCGWQVDGPPAPHPNHPDLLMQAYALDLSATNRPA
ncbi:MAG TPA: GNAT family N-acetyltransferase [Mycobacteriales bacterium]|nr:GNAT family N-acetyltransferase [Mycobacteriales bacterium]